MSLTLPKTCAMGDSKTGLVGTIGVALLNPDGTVHTARATAGIYEIGGGCYGKEITFPDNWKGSLKWDTGGGSPVYATEDYDIEGLIDMIEEDTSKMNFTGDDIKATLDGEKVALCDATEGQIDDIETDTNELQTDWADGGRLDLLIDALALEATLSAIKGAGWCYSDDTEILTEQGWKLFKDIDRTERVATLNPENDLLEYQKPTSYPVFDYNGEMHEYNGQSVNFKVTPNHRQWIRRIGNQNFEFKEAKSLANCHYELKQNAKWNGKEQKYFILPSITLRKISRGVFPYTVEIDSKKILMNDWLEFFGFWIAEGCVTKRKSPTFQYKVVISNTDLNKLHRMQELLKLFGIKSWINYRARCSDLVCTNKQLYTYLLQFGKAKNKFIPREILSLSSRQLSILLDSMVRGDGHKTDLKEMYFTSSRKLADDVQEILLKTNRAGSVNTRTSKGSWGHGSKYCITFIRKRLTPSINQIRKGKRNLSIVNYDGKIYCVEVPNHLIYVRRNGKVLWSGNSTETLKAIKDYVDELESGEKPIPVPKSIGEAEENKL